MNNTTSTVWRPWADPQLISATEVGESIELVYKQYSNCGEPPRIFKLVYCCVGGKWHKKPPVYGRIIPATEESYEI